MANEAKTICVVEETAIAGTRHILSIRDLVKDLSLGDALRFERDPYNAFDPWAIRVFDQQGMRLGYVSCECNEFISRLMDAGKMLEGRLLSIKNIGNWTRISMGVYLYD